MKPIVEGMGLAWHGQFEKLHLGASRRREAGGVPLKNLSGVLEPGDLKAQAMEKGLEGEVQRLPAFPDHGGPFSPKVKKFGRFDPRSRIPKVSSGKIARTFHDHSLDLPSDDDGFRSFGKERNFRNHSHCSEGLGDFFGPEQVISLDMLPQVLDSQRAFPGGPE